MTSSRVTHVCSLPANSEWKSAAQRRALVIADNQLAIGGSGWDEELLRIELATLHEQAYDLDLVGFADVELARLLELQDTSPGLTDPDDVQDVQKESVAIWRLVSSWQPSAHLRRLHAA